MAWSHNNAGVLLSSTLEKQTIKLLMNRISWRWWRWEGRFEVLTAFQVAHVRILTIILVTENPHNQLVLSVFCLTNQIQDWYQNRTVRSARHPCSNIITANYCSVISPLGSLDSRPFGLLITSSSDGAGWHLRYNLTVRTVLLIFMRHRKVLTWKTLEEISFGVQLKHLFIY